MHDQGRADEGIGRTACAAVHSPGRAPRWALWLVRLGGPGQAVNASAAIRRCSAGVRAPGITTSPAGIRAPILRWWCIEPLLGDTSRGCAGTLRDGAFSGGLPPPVYSFQAVCLPGCAARVQIRCPGSADAVWHCTLPAASAPPHAAPWKSSTPCSRAESSAAELTACSRDCLLRRYGRRHWQTEM